MTNSGIVFNIQRYTIHDGPGIRTEVFLKGCSLHCKWCSNPEGIPGYKEVGVYKKKCIGKDHCGACDDVCPTGSIIREEHGFTIGIDRSKCLRCLACAKACPSNALKVWGKEMTVDEVMDEVLADRMLYDKSGGGITVSGGESLLQADFLANLLKSCKDHNIHTCVETALNVPQENVEKVLPYTDMFIFDIKDMDTKNHKELTGFGNEQILERAKFISKSNLPYIIRVPYVPRRNGSKEKLLAICNFIKDELDRKPVQIQVLRFRKLGEEKYESLTIDYPMKDYEVDNEELKAEILEVVEQMKQLTGLPVVAGSTKDYKL